MHGRSLAPSRPFRRSPRLSRPSRPRQREQPGSAPPTSRGERNEKHFIVLKTGREAPASLPAGRHGLRGTMGRRRRGHSGAGQAPRVCQRCRGCGDARAPTRVGPWAEQPRGVRSSAGAGEGPTPATEPPAGTVRIAPTPLGRPRCRDNENNAAAPAGSGPPRPPAAGEAREPLCGPCRDTEPRRAGTAGGIEGPVREPAPHGRPEEAGAVSTQGKCLGSRQGWGRPGSPQDGPRKMRLLSPEQNLRGHRVVPWQKSPGKGVLGSDHRDAAATAPTLACPGPCIGVMLCFLDMEG